MQAPIVKIIVRDGKIAKATFYTPTLPDGEHDLFVDPGDERISELEKELGELRPAYYDETVGITAELRNTRIDALEKALREIGDYIESAGNGIGIEVRIAEIVNTAL